MSATARSVSFSTSATGTVISKECLQPSTRATSGPSLHYLEGRNWEKLGLPPFRPIKLFNFSGSAGGKKAVCPHFCGSRKNGDRHGICPRLSTLILERPTS